MPTIQAFASTAQSGTARISDCRKYRYELTRSWGGIDILPLAFIMLNPSTADQVDNDPTIRKCIGFAKRWGFENIVVNNLFAYRATDPKELTKVSDPVGPDNDEAIATTLNRAIAIVCAWGTTTSPLVRQRAKEVLAGIGDTSRLYCLGMNKDGSPKHPLYRAYDSPLVPFGRPEVRTHP